MKLTGKTAIVTGGGQGIGKAIAACLLEHGARVVIAESDEAAGMETQAQLAALGDILFIRTDVAQEDMVAKAVSDTVNRFGRLDILVNNAGTFCSSPPQDLGVDRWNRVLGVNLTGAFLCAKHAAPHLKAHGGSIVNIASTRALMSEPNTEAYAASKGGLVALTHALALSLAPDVRVNCVSPGWIDTARWQRSSTGKKSDLTQADHAQHPSGRVGIPEDIASLVLFLVSPENSFITGQNFVADGGMTKKMIYV